MGMGARPWITASVAWLALSGHQSYALTPIPMDGAFSQLSSFLSQSVADAAIKTMGIVFDHRAYEPATGLGTKFGLSIGVNAEIVQIPSSLSDALSSAGISGSSLPPLLPGARMINVHKGISDRIDLGFSYLALAGYILSSFDFKLVLFQPEIGPTVAFRLSRSTTYIPLGSKEIQAFGLSVTTVSIDLSTTTWTPQLILGRKLDFAEPYLGVEYQSTSGGLNVSTTNNITIPGVSSLSGSGSNFGAFIGLALKPPSIGLQLTLEGGYSLSGYNYVGAKFGIGL